VGGCGHVHGCFCHAHAPTSTLTIHVSRPRSLRFYPLCFCLYHFRSHAHAHEHGLAVTCYLVPLAYCTFRHFGNSRNVGQASVAYFVKLGLAVAPIDMKLVDRYKALRGGSQIPRITTVPTAWQSRSLSACRLFRQWWPADS